jgi:hypothetical protein
MPRRASHAVAVAVAVATAGCIFVDGPTPSVHDDDDDARVMDDESHATHRDRLQACERTDEPDPRKLLHCLEEANDHLVDALVDETGSPEVVARPVGDHRALGAALCDEVTPNDTDDTDAGVRCRADFERRLGDMMDAYTEVVISLTPWEDAFARCYDAYAYALSNAAVDIDRALAAAGFVDCVEEQIADLADEIGAPDSPAPALLTEDLPSHAHELCAALTVREGRLLPADVPLLCRADLQMLVATSVDEHVEA